MKKKELYRQLVERYTNGTATADEMEVFFLLLNQGELKGYLEEATKDDEEILLHKPDKFNVLKKWSKYGVAAAIILAIGLGMLLRVKHEGSKRAEVMVNDFKNDVLPGGNHAVLTLANGTHIILDSARQGNLATQGGTRILKINVGALSYKVAGKSVATVFYNTVATPAGGQYEITLGDGTKVWLNALSALRFPTVFTGGERMVELTGEAYFEVSGNRNQPFHVKANGIDVEVLGTRFNVNAYTDEASIRTTLLEGSVKLVKAGSNILLKPGEQGQTDGTGLVLVKDADVDQAVAWKNGLFSFEDADIQTVMRQLARWYGIEVRYEGIPTRGLFEGKMQRDLNLTQVLTGLNRSGAVHFHLDGRILTVLP